MEEEKRSLKSFRFKREKKEACSTSKIDSSTEFEDTSKEEEALQSTSSNSQAVESEKLHHESKTGEQEKRQLDKQSSEKKTSTDVDFSDQDSEGLPDVDDKVPKEGVSISKEAKSNENIDTSVNQKVLKGSKTSVSTAESSSNSKNDAVSYKEGENNKEVQLSSYSNIKKDVVNHES
ncbi:hypothetical protein CEXT_780051 [Caerostris extrusa]|uniref:Uncharacterized protein n=1 Tax=Caerostris extrusa TaxID=172846 RepID=A0AAV4X7K8_CAEEX|nr:hypothetical protein CEXT_780051 [Caerostris extrusa]